LQTRKTHSYLNYINKQQQHLIKNEKTTKLRTTINRYHIRW